MVRLFFFSSECIGWHSAQLFAFAGNINRDLSHFPRDRGTITRLGEQLMPKFRETDFLMHWVEKPGIGIDAMDRITLRASEEMMAVDGVSELRLTHRSRDGRRRIGCPNFTNFG